MVAVALAHLDVPGLDIYSTDLEELLPLARQNVELNGMQGRVKVEELYWSVCTAHTRDEGLHQLTDTPAKRPTGEDRYQRPYRASQTSF